MDAGQLQDVLKANGIPVTAVSIRDSAAKGTWAVEYDPSVTPEQMAVAAVLISSFDPQSPAGQEAAQEVAAKQASESLMVRAFYRFFIYTTMGPDAVIDEKMIAQANALLARCFKEAAQG